MSVFLTFLLILIACFIGVFVVAFLLALYKLKKGKSSNDEKNKNNKVLKNGK